MKNTIRTTLTIAALILSLAAGAQVFEATKTGSSAVIKGTSNLHDWEMNITNFTSSFKVTIEEMKVKDISNIIFICKVKDLRSESSIMDKKAWEALKNNGYPEITFTGTSITGLVSEKGKFSGSATGKITMAGQTRDITLPFKGTIAENRTVSIETTTELTMSVFKISPPTALMGTLKTGDKVTVSMKLSYSPKQ